jgi:hypothetical protein
MKNLIAYCASVHLACDMLLHLRRCRSAKSDAALLVIVMQWSLVLFGMTTLLLVLMLNDCGVHVLYWKFHRQSVKTHSFCLHGAGGEGMSVESQTDVCHTEPCDEVPIASASGIPDTDLGTYW